MTMKMRLVGAATVVLFGATGLSAAPCATGTTTNAAGKTTGADQTSDIDRKSTTNVTPGVKSESPGTVGAMNNAGSNTQLAPDEARPAEGKVVKPGSDDC